MQEHNANTIQSQFVTCPRNSFNEQIQRAHAYWVQNFNKGTTTEGYYFRHVRPGENAFMWRLGREPERTCGAVFVARNCLEPK
jgi:hypothetical protein